MYLLETFRTPSSTWSTIVSEKPFLRVQRIFLGRRKFSNSCLRHYSFDEINNATDFLRKAIIFQRSSFEFKECAGCKAFHKKPSRCFPLEKNVMNEYFHDIMITGKKWMPFKNLWMSFLLTKHLWNAKKL